MTNPPPAFLVLPDGTRLAYRFTPGGSPAVAFLGGYSSNMEGTKAVALEAWCRSRGNAFLRFDYAGHGASDGRFIDGTLGRWASDALAVIDAVTEGPLVLVGSSMGGWIMLLVALARRDRVRGLVGIAPAPDFAQELLDGGLPEAALARLRADGVLQLPNPYGPEPTPLTLRFLEEAREQLLLGSPIPLTCPARLFHGMEDADVPWRTSIRLAEALGSDDVVVTLLKGGDHRLSDDESLRRLFEAVGELCSRTAEP